MAGRFNSFADIRKALAALPGPNEAAAAAHRARNAVLTKPEGALGRLEEISLFLSMWQGGRPLRADRLAMRIFAGNHGAAALGVSAYPAEVTVQMVANFERGGAAINQLCRMHGAELSVDAIHLDRPTRDFTQEPAMTEAECVEAFGIGFDRATDNLDLLATGEMGIGNTAAAAALCCALFNGDPEEWVGRGAGVDDRHFSLKKDVVRKAALRCGQGMGGLDLLAALGGRELAAMAGAVLGARLKSIPALLDGYVCCAAIACLWAENKSFADHCLAGHVSAEPGHARLLERLDKKPLLSLGMRLGEGSGAGVAFSLVKAAVACHGGMASFAEAGVSGKR